MSQKRNSGPLTQIITSAAVSQVLDFFLDHKEFDYSPAEIANKTGLSFSTIFRELPMLEEHQIVYVSRKIGKTNMYKLNTDLEAIKHLERFAFEMSRLLSARKSKKLIRPSKLH